MRERSASWDIRLRRCVSLGVSCVEEGGGRVNDRVVYAERREVDSGVAILCFWYWDRRSACVECCGCCLGIEIVMRDRWIDMSL